MFKSYKLPEFIRFIRFSHQMDSPVSAKIRELGVRLGADVAAERFRRAVDMGVLLQTAKIYSVLEHFREIQNFSSPL